MISFTLLPTESVVNVLRVLPPADLRTCRLVCRQLLVTIQESPELQYLLELNCLGFVPPLNPLDTISLSDKLRTLQEKRFVIADETRGDIGGHPVKLDTIGPLSANIRYSRGVLAVGKPSIDVTRQLQLYQLASDNKRTEHYSLLLSDMGVEAHDFRFDPDLDLLVLLERFTNLDSDADLEIRLHLKSLSTGLAHPLVSSPVLRSTFKFTATYNEMGFQIVGKLIAILCFTNSRLDMSSPRMCVWDWTTGELLTSTEVPGMDFAFISENIFLVPVGRLKWSGSDNIGSLLVYSIADFHSGGRARLLASLRLPPTAAGPCHSQCHFISTPYPPTPLVINGNRMITTPKRIYETGSQSHYLCLHVRAYNIQSAPSEITTGMLSIPSSNIHHILDGIPVVQFHSPAHIPWEDWAHGTSWINTRQRRRSSNCVFGHRAALLSLDHQVRGWRGFLYDLRVNIRGLGANEPLRDHPEELCASDTYLNGVFMDPKTDVRGPRVVTSFMISEGEDWNEHTESIPPQLAIDDERIVTYDEEGLRASPELHVYDI